MYRARAALYRDVSTTSHKPIPVRRALALAHHLANRTIWIKHDELIIGNQASEVRAAPIFPEYTVSWIEKEIDNHEDGPVLALR
ncbi:pyruvate formate lyase family protein [Escherichia coli]